MARTRRASLGKQRRALGAAFVLFVAFAGCKDHAAGPPPPTDTEQERPNEASPAVEETKGPPSLHPVRPAADALARHVVVFVADTLRADRVPPNAAPRVRSPSLRRHARGAVSFGRAYAPSNWTKPSVASLFTGLSPRRHGAITHDALLSDDHPILPERMRAAGFHTVGVITNGYVSERFGFGRGWDRLLHSVDTGRSRGHFVVEDVRRVLRERPTDKPLFLYIHTTDVHSPYEPPRAHLASYDPRFYRGPIDFRGDRFLLERIRREEITVNRRDRERLVALYDGEVTYHDRHFGRIRDALGRAGILDDALFVFTSDHGEELFDHGSVAHGGKRVYEELIRVPLLISHPQLPPRHEHVPVSLVDIVPTVLEAAGLPEDDSLPGRSLLGRALTPRPVLIEATDLSAVIADDLKLVSERRGGSMRLFELDNDPEEREDRSGARPFDVARLSALLVALELGDSWPSSVDGVEIDDATQAQLRELGYVE